MMRADLLAEWDAVKPQLGRSCYGCSTGGGLARFAVWATSVYPTSSVLAAMGWSTTDLDRLCSTGRDTDLSAPRRPGNQGRGKASEAAKAWNAAGWYDEG